MGMIKGETLSPNIFNVAVYAVSKHWILMVEDG